MAELSVRFPSDRKSGSIELEGRLRLPDGAIKAPGVVLCHPHPAGRGEMDVPLLTVIADSLGSAGYATLRFNFGGVGGSEGVFSDGVEETGDVWAAFDYLVSLDGVEGNNLSLVGWSFGAWMGLMAIGGGLPARNIVAIAPPLISYSWEGYAERIGESSAKRHYIVGDSDQFCPLTTLEMFAIAVSHEDEREINILSDADHFLFGREQEVAGLVSGILSG
jgi:alpha/beta superfamily hydrolase